MNILCKIFGHWWDKSDKYSYKQECRRCIAVRYRTVDKVKYAYGEKAVGWMIFDLNKL